MENKSKLSGFASMDEQKQREIARKGGLAAHRKGTAHEFTTEEARHAGRKGGQQVSANRAHMTEIGRLGGRKSAERRRIRSNETASTTQKPDQATQSIESQEPQFAASADSALRQFDGDE